MNLHEYQAKALLKEYGVPTPKGQVLFDANQASSAALGVGSGPWVIKAQVHSGGRGKAGGVLVVKTTEDCTATAKKLIGSTLRTHQSGTHALPIHSLLIEEVLDRHAELYLSLLVDRSSESVVVIASASGGMDIEEIAQTDPEKILTVRVDAVAGIQPFHARLLASGLGLDADQAKQLFKILTQLYSLLLEKDLSQVEINPLAICPKLGLVAMDAKINVDDNALFAHSDLEQMRDSTQEDQAETLARQFDLSYVTLDGNIGCMVNGAGLAMATLDVIKLFGGEPANFLDVGGGTTAEKVAQAFKLILSDQKVKALLVNIFGGIVRCDLIAEGIISAVRDVGITIPVIVRLEGTNAEQGRRIIEASDLKVITALDLNDAAKKAVEAAK